ncbi:MAG TPA: hypothetical protein VFH76_17865 [Kribbella sp.]|nr:hypothetical protein [Kribbella sp.]
MANPELPHLTVQKRPAKRMAARLEGRLAVDEATNCIVVAKSHLVEPVWPPGFSIAVRDEALAVLDRDGNTVAEVGETIALCGGFVSAERAHASSRMGHGRVFAVAEGMLVRRATRGE